MRDLLITPGMNMLLTILVIVQCLSLLYTAALFLEFRHVHHKRIAILNALGSERAYIETMQAKILSGIYIVLTLLTAALTSILFIFQPHLL